MIIPIFIISWLKWNHGGNVIKYYRGFRGPRCMWWVWWYAVMMLWRWIKNLCIIRNNLSFIPLESVVPSGVAKNSWSIVWQGSRSRGSNWAYSIEAYRLNGDYLLDFHLLFFVGGSTWLGHVDWSRHPTSIGEKWRNHFHNQRIWVRGVGVTYPISYYTCCLFIHYFT